MYNTSSNALCVLVSDFNNARTLEAKTIGQGQGHSPKAKATP